jgi:hypothetical protein
MTSSPPRRRLLPEPVETTARSSRGSHQGGPETWLADSIPDQNSAPSYSPNSAPRDQTKASSNTRPFLPQPIETSSRSFKSTSAHGKRNDRNLDEQVKADSRERQVDGSPGSQNKSRRLPAPLETTTRSSRKFAPEPVETTTRSNRRRNSEEQDEETPQATRRRFAPEPIETTTKSHRKKQANDSGETEGSWTRRKLVPQPVEAVTRTNCKTEAEAREGSQSLSTSRKFAPEPVETTVRRSRKQTIEKESELPAPDEKTESRSPDGISNPRKFSPELIETARGSYRRGDGSPRLSHLQTTDHPSAVPRYLRPPLAPSNSPVHSSDDVPQIHESRFSAASLAKKQTQQSRQHSFIVPELPCIESDSSEENSAVPSLSTSPSASSEESRNRLRQDRVRESQDGEFQGYMLSLAAQVAEKQLRDQAMAAYPNEQVHEPVQHFAVEDSDEDSNSGKLEGNNGIDPRVFRRESAADLDWHMKEMRRHHAQLQDAKTALKEDTSRQSRFSAAALSARQKTHVKKIVGGNQKGVGLAEMRNAASPPMLGEDLVFPMSVSPKMTRCDVDQIPVPRSHEHEENEKTGESKLWSAYIGVHNDADSGLWMGLCHKKDCDEQSQPTPMRSGLMTPAADVDDVEGASGLKHGGGADKQGHNLLHLPPTPCSPRSDPFTDSVDKKLNEELSIEQQIEQEFHHGFITQIYNYLSLGYPSLAHKFDHELSKISRIPLQELRKDDDLADAKGYVGAPEGEGLDEDSAKEGKCARWTALRLYIHEWARQQPGMADRTPSEWGVRARRGSWAF